MYWYNFLVMYIYPFLNIVLLKYSFYINFLFNCKFVIIALKLPRKIFYLLFWNICISMSSERLCKKFGQIIILEDISPLSLRFYVLTHSHNAVLYWRVYNNFFFCLRILKSQVWWWNKHFKLDQPLEVIVVLF